MRPSKVIYACTFLLAGSVLQLEVALTRIFSVLTWHHFTYMIISIALLGFGASGSYLTLSKKQQPASHSSKRLSGYAFSYAFATIISMLLVTRIQFEPLRLVSVTQLLSLLLYYFVLVVPFFFAGLCLGSIFALYSEDINRIYAADLLGASIGSLFSVLAIRYLGATNTILLVALLAGIAGWLLNTERKPLLASVGVGVLVLSLAAGIYFDPFLVYAPPSKEMYPLVNRQIGTGNLDFSRWHVVARIDVMAPLSSPLPGFGGDISAQSTPTWEYRLVYQDGGALTAILKSDGDVSSMSFLDNYLQSAPYQIQQNPRVLVIGVGGGLDVLIALYYQSEQVIGVDVNPVIVQVITEDYDNYAGGLLTGPNVEILVAEGRHFLSQDKSQYDVIQLSAVDTYAALSSGAYALAENHLYTVEAIEVSWDHLTPNGVLSFSRWHFTPPRETFRLVAAMVQALENQGVAQPGQHIVVVYGPKWAETLLKRQPYTPAEVDALRQWAQENGFSLFYEPFFPQDSEYRFLIEANPGQREDFYQEYAYDVRPSTDDRPFFFNYYKWSNLFKLDQATEQGYAVTRIPLGQLTLLLSLVQILLLTTFGVLHPLRKLRKSTFAGSGSLAAMAYFGALGLGFIFVEIALIQRLMIFLGGPTYSFSTTLFAILLFSGLGSFVARRWNWGTGKALLVLASFVFGLILVVNLILPWAISHWLDYGLVVRGLLAVLLIAPLAFTMGMPFPVGIRILSHQRPDWVPWAWATNSFMTVLGSILCILASMQLGFQWVFVIAALIYLLGFLSFYRWVRRAPGEQSPVSDSYR